MIEHAGDGTLVGSRGPWFFANSRNATSIGLHRQSGFEEVTRKFSFPGVTFEGGEGILFWAQLSGSARRCG